MNYYEKVRDHIERLAECTTSDAQGIIEAWAMKEHPGRGIMADTWAVEVREAAGTDPEQLARTILNMPEEPQKEHTIFVSNGTSDYYMDLTDNEGNHVGKVWHKDSVNPTKAERTFANDLALRYNTFMAIEKRMNALEDAARSFLKFQERSGFMDDETTIEEAEAFYTAFKMPTQ